MHLKQCEAKSIRYAELEELFFSNFEEIDINSLLPIAKDVKTELENIQANHLILSTEIADLQRQINNGTITLLNENSATIRDILTLKITEIKVQLTSKELQLQQTAKRINELSQQDVGTINNVENLRKLKQLFNSCETEKEKIDIRYKLRHQIQSLVEEIIVYPYDSKNPTFWERYAINDGVKATRIYTSLHGIHIKLKNKVQLRMLTAIDYRDINDKSNKPLSVNRIDRKPKYQ